MVVVVPLDVAMVDTVVVFSSGRGYTGRTFLSYGYQGHGYSGYSGHSPGYTQGRGQIHSYNRNNYGPPAQRQQTNYGGYINGGGHCTPFAGRGHGGYAFHHCGPARSGVGSGAYHSDRVQEESKQVNASASNGSGNFQEPAHHHQAPYEEPEVQPNDHYYAFEEEQDFEEPYYGDY